MQGDAEIIIEEKPNTLSLQFDELSTDDDNKTFVWVVNSEERLEKHYVQTGLEGDIYTEVPQELSSLTIVIPNNDKQELKEGATAKIVD
jgi:hypothetical protein